MWWITVGLILVGILLMVIEFLLVPGIGIAGFLSFLSLGFACWYTFANIGYYPGWWVTIFVLILLVIMLVIILRARTWKRFQLETEVKSKVNEEPHKVSVGEKGIAKTRLAPMGTGVFSSVICEVKSFDNTMIDPGSEIEVVAIEDNQVIVKQIV